MQIDHRNFIETVCARQAENEAEWGRMAIGRIEWKTVLAGQALPVERSKAIEVWNAKGSEAVFAEVAGTKWRRLCKYGWSS